MGKDDSAYRRYQERLRTNFAIARVGVWHCAAVFFWGVAESPSHIGIFRYQRTMRQFGRSPWYVADSVRSRIDISLYGHVARLQKSQRANRADAPMEASTSYVNSPLGACVYLARRWRLVSLHLIAYTGRVVCRQEGIYCRYAQSRSN